MKPGGRNRAVDSGRLWGMSREKPRKKRALTDEELKEKRRIEKRMKKRAAHRRKFRRAMARTKAKHAANIKVINETEDRNRLLRTANENYKERKRRKTDPGYVRKPWDKLPATKRSKLRLKAQGSSRSSIAPVRAGPYKPDLRKKKALKRERGPAKRP